MGKMLYYFFPMIRHIKNSKYYVLGPLILLSDSNGTYLSFSGWPFFKILSCASALGCINNGSGFGHRLTALGSTRPGLLPTRRCAINMNSVWVSSCLYVCLVQISQSCRLCLKLNSRGRIPF